MIQPGWRWCASGVVALLAVWQFWPESTTPARFIDSFEYLRWPLPQMRDGVLYFGSRPVAYPAILAVVGGGAALVHLQTWVSCASWATLGSVLGGLPGTAVGLLFALCTPIRLWNHTILTESFSLSCLALLVACGVRLSRQPSGILLFCELVLLVFFGLIRDANLFLLPFLIAPLAFARPEYARTLLVVGCVVLAVGVFDASRQERWKPGVYTAFLTRVALDDEAVRDLRSKGMPQSPFRDQRAEFLVWLKERGRKHYFTWVLSNPKSYTQPWQFLYVGGRYVRKPLAEHFAERFWVDRVWHPSRLADALFESSALPLWLAPLLVLALLLDSRRGGVPSVEAVWVAVLALGVFAHTFVSYHSGGDGEARHVLAGSVLFRVLVVWSLFLLLESLAGRWRPAPGAT